MNYTDYLGNPVHCGDLIVYPSASGSSAAEMNLAVIEEVLPITPNNPSDPKDRSGTMEGDDRKRYAPYREIPGHWVRGPGLQNGYGDYLRDDTKAYQLRVRKRTDGAHPGLRNVDEERLTRIKNVDRIVVVTSLRDPV